MEKNAIYIKNTMSGSIKTQPNSSLYLILCLMTSMIGYHMHRSIFWSILDWIFMPFVWGKWLILQEINMTIIKEAFSFFFK